MSRLLVLGGEIAIAAGAANSTTVNSATVVRVMNNSGSTVQVYLQDSSFSGIGSFTMLTNTTELVEKKGSDLIYGTGGVLRLVKVGFTG